MDEDEFARFAGKTDISCPFYQFDNEYINIRKQNQKGCFNMSNPKILIEVENFGSMTAELYPEKAPKTVENFLSLVNDGFYTNLIFHRVIE